MSIVEIKTLRDKIMKLCNQVLAKNNGTECHAKMLKNWIMDIAFKGLYIDRRQIAGNKVWPKLKYDILSDLILVWIY